ncbi:MAG: hypothetical protein RR063_07355 [Anaerovoracaceae bacterium]
MIKLLKYSHFILAGIFMLASFLIYHFKPSYEGIVVYFSLFCFILNFIFMGIEKYINDNIKQDNIPL